MWIVYVMSLLEYVKKAAKGLGVSSGVASAWYRAVGLMRARRTKKGSISSDGEKNVGDMGISWVS